MKNNKKRILIVAGGTGGHVFPAYNLYKNLRSKKTYVEIITDKRGKIFLNKYDKRKFKTIFSSTINYKNPFSFICSIIIILMSFLQSIFLIINKKADLVIGMGGYTSLPFCMASKVLDIPFIIYENNLLLGKANKFLLPFSKKILISYKELKGIKSKYFDKIIVTGNILNKKILNFNTATKKKPGKLLNLLILGGSQAANSFGKKIPVIIKKCREKNIKISIYQQCTNDQIKKLKKYYSELKIKHEVFNFKNNLHNYFKKIDICITRAGSSMLAELVNCRVPFISIPLPNSADNHQFLNAEFFKKKNMGFLVEEIDIEKKLFALINSFNKDKSILSRITINQKKYNDKDVYKKIEKSLEEI
tara:strand:- start:341 stop:1423 length:1083 start_codon:yes stop_codon:yes gene_type:complete